MITSHVQTGRYVKFRHVGTVIIGDDVEIGGNAVIVRGSLGATVIKQGVKLDNLVHISDDVGVGRDSLLNANATVSGGVNDGE